MYIYTNPSTRAGYDTRSIFKQRKKKKPRKQAV